MKVTAVDPKADTGAHLAGAQFCDAYSVALDGATLDARGAAERMFATQPRWIAALMGLRNAMVAPFGLKTPVPPARPSAGSIGIFPVLKESPGRLVAGLDDRHLDFRVVVDVVASGRGQRVTTTTLVRTHNLLGRSYLAIILPFHRLVVRAMMRRLAA